MQGDLDPSIQHTADSLQIAAALRAIERREVFAEHLNQAGMENWADIHSRHPVDQVLINNHTVFNPVA